MGRGEAASRRYYLQMSPDRVDHLQIRMSGSKIHCASCYASTHVLSTHSSVERRTPQCYMTQHNTLRLLLISFLVFCCGRGCLRRVLIYAFAICGAVPCRAVLPSAILSYQGDTDFTGADKLIVQVDDRNNAGAGDPKPPSAELDILVSSMLCDMRGLTSTCARHDLPYSPRPSKWRSDCRHPSAVNMVETDGPRTTAEGAFTKHY